MKACKGWGCLLPGSGCRNQGSGKVRGQQNPTHSRGPLLCSTLLWFQFSGKDKINEILNFLNQSWPVKTWRFWQRQHLQWKVQAAPGIKRNIFEQLSYSCLVTITTPGSGKEGCEQSLVLWFVPGPHLKNEFLTSSIHLPFIPASTQQVAAW